MARGLADFSPFELRAQRTNFYARPDRVSMTAEQLAQAVGASKAQILAYENGHRVPDPPRLRRLAEALEIHPSRLMSRDVQSWDVANIRRACGLRARDVVEQLGISPKSYRRFETEGIVPARRPGFLDEVCTVLGLNRRGLERAIDSNPVVRARQNRAAELVTRLAERYVPRAGRWSGPDPQDPELIELAVAYGRPVQRTRRVLAYELGELRMFDLRAAREEVIADYDTNPERQLRARQAVMRWRELSTRYLERIPDRLEQFHRSAQPSDAWQRMAELYAADARADTARDGAWAPATLFSGDVTVPLSLVERRTCEGIRLLRLSFQGVSHVRSFHELYAALYPTVRKPRIAHPRGRQVPENSAVLPNRSERIVIPPWTLETLRETATGKQHVLMDLSSRIRLSVGPASLSLSSRAHEPETVEEDLGTRLSQEGETLF